MTAEAIRAVSWRLNIHDDLRREQGTLFAEPFEFIPNSRCLHLARLPTLNAKTTVTPVYAREATRTYVTLLRGTTGPPVICKAFAIRGPTGSSDCWLSEHEVEVRYLLLMTALMRHGLTDAATLPLGLAVTSREGLRQSGLLTTAHTAEMFPERRKGSTGQYAVVFAEAADASLTDYLWHSSRHTGPNTDYLCRAALLQVFLALATLQSIFPSFRHNDLHASNVLVQRIDPAQVRASLGDRLPANYPLVVEYRLAGKTWQVDLDRAPFRCLLWDFSFASIEEQDAARAGVDCVTPREPRFGSLVTLSKTSPNQFCDLHRVVDTLRWLLRQGDGRGWDALSDRTREQMSELVPAELSYASKDVPDRDKRDRQLLVHGSLQRTSPTQALLYNDLFSELRVDTLPPHRRVRPVYSLHARLGKHGEDLVPRSLLEWPILHTGGTFSN
jgi:hypothetical protein